MRTVAQIHQLSEGFVLDLGETTVACTTVNALVRAIRAALPVASAPAASGQVVALPVRPHPSPAEVRAALSPAPTQPREPDPFAHLVPPPQGPTPGPGLQPVQALAPEERANLYRLADAVYRGLLKCEDIQPNLEKYVPSLDKKTWDLFLAEYIADRRADED